MLKIKAIGVSEGLARAKALVIRDVDLTVVRNTLTDIEAEQQRTGGGRKRQGADRGAAGRDREEYRPEGGGDL